MKKRNKLLTYTILVFLLFSMLIARGSAIESNRTMTTEAELHNIGDNIPAEEEAVEDKSNSSDAIVQEEVEEDPNEAGDTRENGDNTRENSEDAVSDEQESATIVELSAKHVGGNPGSITMIFDLVSGEVSGNLEFEYKEVFLDGNKTVLCFYDIEGEIKGTMDLEDRTITAQFIGEARSQDRGCYNGELKFSLTGKISKDYSVARGSTGYGGVDWSAFK